MENDIILIKIIEGGNKHQKKWINELNKWTFNEK